MCGTTSIWSTSSRVRLARLSSAPERTDGLAAAVDGDEGLVAVEAVDEDGGLRAGIAAGDDGEAGNRLERVGDQGVLVVVEELVAENGGGGRGGVDGLGDARGGGDDDGAGAPWRRARRAERWRWVELRFFCQRGQRWKPRWRRWWIWRSTWKCRMIARGAVCGVV